MNLTMTQAQPVCEYCLGAGVLFEHARDCRDDLCALNGDEHSCDGEVVPCTCQEPSAVGETGSKSDDA